MDIVISELAQGHPSMFTPENPDMYKPTESFLRGRAAYIENGEIISEKYFIMVLPLYTMHLINLPCDFHYAMDTIRKVIMTNNKDDLYATRVNSVEMAINSHGKELENANP